MAFKLPMQSKMVRNQGRFTHSGEEAAPGTPIIRKDLAPGIMAEANDDGTIFVSNKSVPGSVQEMSTLSHEMQHITDMKTGKLAYTDDMIMWNGNNYQRLEDGKVMFEGTKYNEGDKKLPWEKVAMLMGYKMKGFSGFTNDKYKIDRSDIDGIGAIANANIKKGELIGTAIDNEARIKTVPSFDTRTILGKSLNHQDTENAIQKSENNALNVYASKNIKEGQEISINYNKAPNYVKNAVNTSDFK